MIFTIIWQLLKGLEGGKTSEVVWLFCWIFIFGITETFILVELICELFSIGKILFTTCSLLLKDSSIYPSATCDKHSSTFHSLQKIMMYLFLIPVSYSKAKIVGLPHLARSFQPIRPFYKFQKYQILKQRKTINKYFNNPNENWSIYCD